MKTDKQLVEIKYITWMPWSMRQARQGQFDSKAKIVDSARIWVPFPTDDEGNHAPELMKPEEQGVTWAAEMVGKLKPKGHEILTIMSVVALDVYESQIANQPTEGGAADGSDFGMPKAKSNLILP